MSFLVALIVFFKPPVRNVSVCVSVCGLYLVCCAYSYKFSQVERVD
ncbi:hypothetical protein HMPREF3190_00499 [Umbribacter vaginalis]|nr:hypothetical protein HMPREF3190_00499 [Coriobacteriales bacterium DNF00809]